MKFKEIQLGNLFEAKYGKSLPKNQRRDGNIKVYGSGGISGYHDTALVKGPGIVIGRKGTVGSLYYEKQDYFPIDTTYYIEKSDKYDLKYIFYLLNTLNLNKMNTHSAVPGLNRENLYSLIAKVPEKKYQIKISEFLQQLDSKIELNNQIISNLEELASTLFKRWFVDFEFPDENGNPYKSSGGKMVDSELGEIPEGWEVTNLEEISIDIITGKTPNTKQKENYGEDIPFIKIPDMHNNTYIVQTETYLSKKGSDSQYKKLLPKDSICVSCIATPGLVSITSVASHTNQQINTILPKVEDLYFLYLDLKRKRNLIRELGSGGSTTLNLNKTQFGKINIINCGKREKMNFNKICEPLFSKILLLQKSNIYLAKLRDSLLPKLLSGEIELPEDEEV
ncbi:restriction endonuclease subunit S [Enterococcus faecium]|uniref:restriction endonuclease subunit S n=1 Tax=Enterococcus faecium TaxID=1352 RepID=UPI001E38A25A|nr:restriction endonuclease subunit S [Enterococcus faecium]MCD5098425.1 restriction endonuclease subunit S [Enterococcus faecium]